MIDVEQVTKQRQFWVDQLAELKARAEAGEENLELSAAMCTGASIALGDLLQGDKKGE